MKPKIALPVIVEGKYDKITLSGIFDCTVITTQGFGIFNSKEKQALLRRICKDGAIVLVDSDGGGVQIRSFLSGILPKEKIYNLYIPKIEGKERRKKTAGKAGTLGVEGMSREVLERIFAPFITAQDNSENAEKLNTGCGIEGKNTAKRTVTKLDFYKDGLSGAENSSLRRRELCTLMNLPADMSANALLEAVNLLYSFEEYEAIVREQWAVGSEQ